MYRQIFLVALLAVGCTRSSTDTGRDSDSGSGTDTDTGPEFVVIDDPTHEEHIQPLWNAHCEDCHTRYNEGGLRLIDAFDRIVNIASEDVPGMSLIEPFEPEASYLWHKISGTHEDVGGQGVTMPKALPRLREQERQTIRNWIEDGAPR